ncbi:Epidermal growth factor-related protein [Cavenderia fasciculata]|uniref:Epidermal growth factor-related protein n=1 Tax=Cavenderia fasciculata TaxID=261658 RepID=F4PXT5_CACFS|nr:Epidermal growth factor-related protein [Cavenderia fasciculata]EGG19595.1 Epidermal growth factor-related protein [Cavenderia fasciculata]|eukprot:XP_004357889.1 Epidermal growth factor-related protein [Cavenderia fasciculata]
MEELASTKQDQKQVYGEILGVLTVFWECKSRLTLQKVLVREQKERLEAAVMLRLEHGEISNKNISFVLGLEEYEVSRALKKKSILRYVRSQDYKRALAEQKGGSDAWIKETRDFIVKHGIKQENIFNIDEKGVLFTDTKQKVDESIKLDCVQFFVKQLTTPGDKLLLVDNHGSNFSPELLQWANENKVHIKSFPSNMTHILQPLDLVIFSSFSQSLKNMILKQLQDKPNFKIAPEHYQQFSYFAWVEATKPTNVMAAWNKSGIINCSPLSPQDQGLIPKPPKATKKSSKALALVQTTSNALVTTDSLPHKQRSMMMRDKMSTGTVWTDDTNRSTFYIYERVIQSKIEWRDLIIVQYGALQCIIEKCRDFETYVAPFANEVVSFYTVSTAPLSATQVDGERVSPLAWEEIYLYIIPVLEDWVTIESLKDRLVRLFDQISSHPSFDPKILSRYPPLTQLQKYRLNIALDAVVICSSVYFTCFDGHVTQMYVSIVSCDACSYMIDKRDLILINIVIISKHVISDISTLLGVDNGMPNPSLQLLFPELTSFSYDGTINTGVANQSSSFLDKLVSCCPKVSSIKFVRDPSVKGIPDSFSQIPNLDVATLILQFVSPIVLKSNPTLSSLDIRSDDATEFIFDSSVNLPNLTTLTIGSPQIVHVSNFTIQTFPKLRFLNPHFAGSQDQLQINLGIPTLEEISFVNGGGPVPFAKLRFTGTLNLISLSYYGEKLSFDPPLDSFRQLKRIKITNYQSNNYPFLSYPPYLERFELTHSSFNTIPPIPVPNSLINLILSSNQIQGPIDFDSIFGNYVGFLLGLDIQENPLSGALDQESVLCRLRFINASQTTITSIPLCFWCYESSVIRFIKPPSVIPPSSPVCDVTVDSTTLYTVNQRTTIYGSLIGWGSDANGILLHPLIANKRLSAIIPTPVSGPPLTYTINFSSMPPILSKEFSVAEVGFRQSAISVVQAPNQTAIIQVTFTNVNDYFNHVVIVKGVNSIIIKVRSTYININSNNSELDINLIFFNSLSIHSFIHSIGYPIVSSVVQSRTNIILGGYFGGFLDSAKIVIVQNSGLATCSVSQFYVTIINCTIISPFSTGMATLNVTVDGYTIQRQYLLESIQDDCEINTNHCHGNGQCSIFGDCICNINQGSYYNNCSNPYPFITAGKINDFNSEQRLISLYGDFGPFGQNDTTVTINNTINCIIDLSISDQFNINCSLLSSPTTFGLASVQLNVSGLLYSKGRVLKFIDPSTNPGGSTTTTTTTTTTSTSTSGGGGGESPKELCQKNTQNCYGHGDCDNNGVCQCQEKYNPIDNCATKFTDNSTFTPNTTSPSSKIEVDGVEFEFEIVAIQEIGVDNEISRELLTNSWLSSISTNSTMTNAIYDLVISNTSILADTNVTVTITFSTLPRTVMFGDQQLLINPNAIKLAVSITNWQYTSNIGTLRVVIKTTINNQQSMQYDCKETEIDSFSYGADGEIQYLRVIKDNVQFNGRFIDFALANGRPTYSQTFVINQTEISGDSDQSVAMIGITLPQCQECILDPDFTPLLVVNDKNDNCDGSSNTWKIIVGCVVGGIAFVAIATVSIMYTKKKLIFNIQNKQMKLRLKEIN